MAHKKKKVARAKRVKKTQGRARTTPRSKLKKRGAARGRPVRTRKPRQKRTRAKPPLSAVPLEEWIAGMVKLSTGKRRGAKRGGKTH